MTYLAEDDQDDRTPPAPQRGALPALRARVEPSRRAGMPAATDGESVAQTAADAHAARIEAAIEANLAQAPPLTDAQKARLALLLRRPEQGS